MTTMGHVQNAGHSDAARKVVLAGWAAKGVVYLALAYLVLQIAFGSASQQASTTGALQYIASTGAGTFTLVVLGLGLLAFAVGRILEVTTLAGPQIDTKDKATAGVLALLYTSLAISAFGLAGLTGTSGSGSGGSEQQGSAFLLGLPGGQFIVGILGLAVVAYGLYEAYKGIKKEFLNTLRTGEMSQSTRKATNGIGTAAYVTKGAIFALVGYFLVQSALTYNPQEAKGLDAALAEISQQPWGQVVLVLVAIGLLAYSLFAFLESRYRKVGSSASGTA